MSLQSSFVFQPEADANDSVFVPERAVLLAYAAGEISADQAGLHNYYGCQRDPCPQCNARLEATYEFEAAVDEFFEGIE